MTSPYEAQRLANIARNESILHDLGIDSKVTMKRQRQVKSAKPSDVITPRKNPRRSTASSVNYNVERVIEVADDSSDRMIAPKRKKASIVNEDDEKVPTSAAVLHDLKVTPKPFEGFRVAASSVKRLNQNGSFVFAAAADASPEEKKAIASFKPNRSPEEILRAGSFGGTYFRTIYSSVVKKDLVGAWKELPDSWILGLRPDVHLARPWKKYDESLNKFGVKSGTSLEDWEASGWITSYDVIF